MLRRDVDFLASVERHAVALCVLGLLLGLLIFRLVIEHFRRRQLANQSGCQPGNLYLSRNRIFGIDHLVKNLKNLKKPRSLVTFTRRFNETGTSFEYSYLGSKFFATIEPENMKWVLSDRSSDFDQGHRRRAAMAPLLGKGIFAVDGEEWRHSRALLRPIFSKSRLNESAMAENHFQILLKCIERGKYEVDLQDLFHRFTMDSATELLFGRSVHSLLMTQAEIRDSFSHPWDVAAEALVDVLRLGPLAGLFAGRDIRKAEKRVHEFIDRVVHEALEKGKYCEDRVDDNERQTSQGYIFLHELLKTTQDPRTIREHLLSALIGGRDTTASLLATSSSLWHGSHAYGQNYGKRSKPWINIGHPAI